MNASHRQTAPARAPARRGLGSLAVAGILAASLVACGSATTSPGAPGPARSAGPTATATPVGPAPTATPVAYADTLRVGWSPDAPPPAFRGYAPMTWSPTVAFAGAVYSGLYRYDAQYGPIPDLADGPCVPQGDGTVIRCRIVATTFHDGAPLTADDVASTYRLFAAPSLDGAWVGPTFRAVRVVDPLTVEFVLSAVDPTFLSVRLPKIPILSQRGVEASVADFAAATADVEPGALTELADAIREETGRDPTVCSAARLEEVDDIFEKLGVHLYREDFRQANGSFDPCWYLATASDEIRWVADGLRHTGLDAAYDALLFMAKYRPPVGTGPYRLVAADADRVHLEAFDDYHGGRAATRYLDFVRAAGDGTDLEQGLIDLSQRANLGSAFQVTAHARGVEVVTLPTPAYLSLAFNVRPGRLFADPALREALQLCVDLPFDVDAATGGTGTPVYGPVLPGSWADDPALPTPPRDVAAAKRLIEGAGWQLGADGIYARDGVRLEAKVPVRDNTADRIRMVDLIGGQARDCGMDLSALPTPYDAIKSQLLRYPHYLPGTSTPFDVYVAGWVSDPDPSDGLGLYLSSNVSDVDNPGGLNFGGFSDPAYDQLVAAANATYDQVERARLYRLAQQELAAQLPVLFLWAPSASDAVRAAVATVDGPLDLSVPNWGWAPERLVVADR